MLKLENITKDYMAGTTTVHALKGVSVAFRDSEFVSVLGPSGCGKTTLLNIIGGLDRYTDGDLVVNGTSTKEYKDGDWDAYRNHTIGFVFQTYNLIAHQTVLGNVELALTLSGVSPKERRALAAAALEKVGLKEQMNKRPNQLSGGQMQRVAIARAIVNDPDIILADEPTGALDTKTSVQVMDILKEISKDRLVVMVTHNPELAERYSTRIVHLTDGLITSDSNPVTDAEIAAENEEKIAVENASDGGAAGADRDGGNFGRKGQKPPKTRKKRPSMSFWTAMSLSFKNLLTKKARTILVSFAGSIGIIGIALILSLSSGFQLYINRVQEDTLSNYPLTIEKEALDMSGMLSAMLGLSGENEENKVPEAVYSNELLRRMMLSVVNSRSSNNLEAFKTAIEEAKEGDLKDSISAIKYGYRLTPQVFMEGDEPLNAAKTDVKVNPSDTMNNLFAGLQGGSGEGGNRFMMNAWSEMLENQRLLESQYDLVGDGRWPQNAHELVIVVDRNEEISDYVLYSLGLLDSKDLYKMMTDVMFHPDEVPESEPHFFTYDQLLSLSYRLVPQPDLYDFDETSGKATAKNLNNADVMKEVVEGGIELKVVGIIKPKESAAATSIDGTIGYTHALTEELSEIINNSEIVKYQLAHTETDVLTGEAFDVANTMDSTLEKLGCIDLESPDEVNIYAVDFASKDKITEWIEGYNASASDEDKIDYTDYVDLMMSSISTIISAISWVLIAFVAISLVVSSIMIGIITYISVLERTKEIGILRSIGASKRDISRVFNAETFIVGLAAGLIGIAFAALIDIPINLILALLANLSGIAAVPWWGAIGLVAISVVLTLIAGIIPSRLAAKRDPVVALRTE